MSERIAAVERASVDIRLDANGDIAMSSPKYTSAHLYCGHTLIVEIGRAAKGGEVHCNLCAGRRTIAEVK